VHFIFKHSLVIRSGFIAAFPNEDGVLTPWEAGVLTPASQSTTWEFTNPLRDLAYMPGRENAIPARLLALVGHLVGGLATTEAALAAELPAATNRAAVLGEYNGDAHVADMQQQTLGTTPSSVLALSLSKALAIAPHIDDGARDATTTNADTNTDRSPSPSPRKKKDRKNHKKKDPTVSETMCFMDCDGTSEAPWIFCGEGYYIRLGTTPTVILIDGSVQYHGASLSSFLHPYLSASPNCVRGSCCPQALHFMTTRMAASARRWSRSPPLSLRSMAACAAPRTRGSFEWRG
jgi:hypothetical protein